LVDSVSSLLDSEVKPFSDPSDGILLAPRAQGDPAFSVYRAPVCFLRIHLSH